MYWFDELFYWSCVIAQIAIGSMFLYAFIISPIIGFIKLCIVREDS